MKNLVESINEGLSNKTYPVITAMTFKQFLAFIKNSKNKNKTFSCVASVDPEVTVSEIVRANRPSDAYYSDEYKDWMSYSDDTGEMPVSDWTLGDDDIIFITNVK